VFHPDSTLLRQELRVSHEQCLLTLLRPRRSDDRIQTLMRNGVQEKKRSFFVVVGDNPKDVIVKLHYIMSRNDVKRNKSVLWAYKTKLLGFTR
jgi:N-acetyltransferase 10